CLVFILIITGCAPMRLIDKVSSDSPKGYAEFFCRNDKGYSDCKRKISLIKKKGEYIFVGNVSNKRRDSDSYKAGYIIARSPGYYYVSTLEDTYYFHIEEGMVTPIEITLEVSISKVMQPWGLVDKYRIKADLSNPGEPIPIEEYSKNGMK
ncbi:MAG: hypothetical protein NTZ83_00305, partial [Candidatus Pacearchaeota archaeon]|nr:hypothetical protein [Candidatus Pacearchaeota archaeon]